MRRWATDIYRRIDAEYATHTKVARFIVSGGSAAATNLGTLFVLTHVLGLWYIFSSVIAFLVSFGVSFTLQKYWTFRDHSRDRIRAQATIYFAVLIIGLLVNTFFMYVLVEKAGLHYLLSAILSGAAIAVFNFIAYQRLIFVSRSVKPQEGMQS